LIVFFRKKSNQIWAFVKKQVVKLLFLLGKTIDTIKEYSMAFLEPSTFLFRAVDLPFREVDLPFRAVNLSFEVSRPLFLIG